MKIKQQFLAYCIIGLTNAGPSIAAAPVRAEMTAGEINDTDYPAVAMRRGEEGTVVAAFTIGVNGRVGDCTSSATQQIPVLEAITCRIIQERFIYKPALDARGKAIADTRTQRITWRMPKPDPSNFPETTIRKAEFQTTYTIKADGTVTDCTATGTTFDGTDIGKLCAERKRMWPLRDDQGRMVAKRIVENHAIDIQPVP